MKFEEVVPYIREGKDIEVKKEILGGEDYWERFSPNKTILLYEVLDCEFRLKPQKIKRNEFR
jgi:hypothetical protein